MSSTDIIVFGSCAVMILAGVAIIRLSREQRGMGAIGVALGVIGFIAYLGAEEGAPPPEATPTVAVTQSPSDATPAS